MKAVLAQFLELGSAAATNSGGGSHALSKDYSDLFLQSIEVVARSVAGTMNKQAMTPLRPQYHLPLILPRHLGGDPARWRHWRER